MGDIASRIYLHYAGKVDGGFRPHLGASEIGGDCARANWYSFRWAARRITDGRMLRLVQRGNLEEPVIANDLRAIGITVHTHTPTGAQYEYSAFGGHFAGHMDGAATGVPGLPEGSWCVLEFKTANEKRQKKLHADGVRKAKPEHYGQMQIYMGGMGLPNALYLSICKNDDDIYEEIVPFDQAEFDRLMERAKAIISSDQPPPRISNNPSWWQCKFCDYQTVCHGDKRPEVTCRSCAHSTPELAGGWSCARHAIAEVPVDAQRSGCTEHRYIPILLEKFATVVQASDRDNWVQYQLTPAYGGETFVNGPRPGLSSIEIRDNAPGVLGHPAIEQAFAQFPQATLVTTHEQVQIDLGSASSEQDPGAGQAAG